MTGYRRYRMIRMRSNDDAVEMLGKAKDLMESATEMMEAACDMLKQGMNERTTSGRMIGRDRMMSRDWREEERMRDRDHYDGMYERGGRFDY